LALGVAVGIKVTALLPAMAIGAFLVVIALRRGLRHVPALVAGALIMMALPLPWLVQSIALTGYPLSPMPIQIAGMRLGLSNAAMSWYAMQLTKPTLSQELVSLQTIFEFLSVQECLGAETLPLICLLPVAIWQLRRRRPWAALMIAALAASVLAAFYLPGFAVVRILWALTSSRFLLSLAILGAVTAGVVAARRGLRSWLDRYFRMVIGVHVFITATVLTVWSTPATRMLSVLLGLTGLTAVTWVVARPRSLVRRAAVPAALIGVVAATQIWKDTHRYQLVAGSRTLHWSPSYWAAAARAVDEPNASHVIAVTAGPQQAADNQWFYYFFGRRLQNQLIYVSIFTSGKPEPFPVAAELSAAADDTLWRRRLDEQHVEYVLSLWPASVELHWMEQAPSRFERVAGAPAAWGLFRVVR
jgi:hypothetical protein